MLLVWFLVLFIALALALFFVGVVRLSDKSHECRSRLQLVFFKQKNQKNRCCGAVVRLGDAPHRDSIIRAVGRHNAFALGDPHSSQPERHKEDTAVHAGNAPSLRQSIGTVGTGHERLPPIPPTMDQQRSPSLRIQRTEAVSSSP